ncbi:MAG: hypothetical protein QM572_08945, partial [Nocardioides sp.]|uniref:hypothetical protein n=1 Tax=Nocardioides sp. TaxID=35761 RepID=UPI0039E49D6B
VPGAGVVATAAGSAAHPVETVLALRSATTAAPADAPRWPWAAGALLLLIAAALVLLEVGRLRPRPDHAPHPESRRPLA